MLSNLLFVATHREMYEAARRVSVERGEPLDILEGDLFDALEKVRGFDLSGKEVIVCRGGTAQLLRERCHLPVVEVEVGAYDLLRAVYPYRGQRIAVIGAESVISGARVLGDVMALPMRYFPAVFEQDIEQTLEKNTGEIDVVVGDAVAYRVACRRAIPGEMVRSGVEAVREAIENAEKICDAIALEREKNSRINAIIEHLREGIVVSDERGEVALLNRAAEQMLGRTRREAVGMPLEGLLDGVGRTTELVDEGGLRRRLLHTAGGIIAAKYIPIVTNGAARGTVVACEDVTRIQELEQEIRRTMAKRGLIARRSFSDIIGESAEIKNAIRLAREYAAVDSTVLLYGESGTGKELFAQSLHNESPRRAGPFVAVNCATLPHDLLESTLFGYEDGAFTGAKKGGSKGLFELAHRGTLFLDEIAEMDLETQAKLLRVLQEREVMRLGGDSIIPVDVRIVASSNQRLIRLVQQGKYRADLYYRLSVLNIDIPALRQRKGDVALLARWLMAQVARRYGRSPAALSEAALRVLEQYRWPGNIRQLENVAQRIVLTAGARELSASEVESFLEELDDAEDSIALAEPSDGAPPDGSLEEIIRASVLQVLAAEDYNKTRAAKRLGITRATLNRRLEEHELK